MLRPGDVFFTLGAGDVNEVGPLVLEGTTQMEGVMTGLNEKLVEELRKVGGVRLNEPVSRHTTFGIGGPADIYVVADDAAQLKALVTLCNSHGEPFFILGAGSNILVSDKGIRGVTIENRARALEGPLGGGRRPRHLPRRFRRQPGGDRARPFASWLRRAGVGRRHSRDNRRRGGLQRQRLRRQHGDGPAGRRHAQRATAWSTSWPWRSWAWAIGRALSPASCSPAT